MNKFRALLTKEFSFYINTSSGYIIAALFGALANFLFIKDLFLRGNSSLRPFFDLLPWLLLILTSALCMRIFAEERRMSTLETLLTLPVSEVAVVLSKFTAALFFVITSLFLTVSLPLTLSVISKISLTETAISYFGAIFLAASLTTVAMLISSITKNQIVAFLTSILVLFFLTLFGTGFFNSFTPQLVQAAIVSLSPLTHYESFLRGLIELRSVFYFLSLSVAALFLTVVNLKKRG